jgi:hypothetical protein
MSDVQELVTNLLNNAWNWNVFDFARHTGMSERDGATQEAFLQFQKVADILGRFGKEPTEVIFSKWDGSTKETPKEKKRLQSAHNNPLLAYLKTNKPIDVFLEACKILNDPLTSEEGAKGILWATLLVRGGLKLEQLQFMQDYLLDANKPIVHLASNAGPGVPICGADPTGRITRGFSPQGISHTTCIDCLKLHFLTP